MSCLFSSPLRGQWGQPAFLPSSSLCGDANASCHRKGNTRSNVDNRGHYGELLRRVQFQRLDEDMYSGVLPDACSEVRWIFA